MKIPCASEGVYIMQERLNPDRLFLLFVSGRIRWSPGGERAWTESPQFPESCQPFRGAKRGRHRNFGPTHVWEGCRPEKVRYSSKVGDITVVLAVQPVPCLQGSLLCSVNAWGGEPVAMGRVRVMSPSPRVLRTQWEPASWLSTSWLIPLTVL